MTPKNIFSTIILVIFLGLFTYVNSVDGLVYTIIVIIFYYFLMYFFHYIWKKFRGHLSLSLKEYLEVFIYRLSVFIVLVIFIIGGFAFYNNTISPAPAPTIKLTNGKKELIFQTMSHIGTKEFYKSVIDEITLAKEKGYVLFYEGVKEGTKENKDKFDEALGIKFDQDIYENMSKLYGTINQNNNWFLNIVNDKDYNIDFDMNTLVETYEEKVENTNREESFLEKNSQATDISKVVTERLANLNDKQLKILIYINRGILNFIIKSDYIRESIIDNLGNNELFSVILYERNKFLTEKILESEENRIFILYGLMHFDGVLELLKENDPNWEIVSTTDLYPIK